MDRYELTRLKLFVKNDIMMPDPSNSLMERRIDDPWKICAHVHKTSGTPSKPLFGKTIKVNEDHSKTSSFIYEEHSRLVTFEDTSEEEEDSFRKVWIEPSTPEKTRKSSIDRRPISPGPSQERHHDCSLCRARHHRKTSAASTCPFMSRLRSRSPRISRKKYSVGRNAHPIISCGCTQRSMSPFASTEHHHGCVGSTRQREGRSFTPACSNKTSSRLRSRSPRFIYSTGRQRSRRSNSRSVSPPHDLPVPSSAHYYGSLDSRRPRRSRSVSLSRHGQSTNYCHCYKRSVR